MILEGGGLCRETSVLKSLMKTYSDSVLSEHIRLEKQQAAIAHAQAKVAEKKAEEGGGDDGAKEGRPDGMIEFTTTSKARQFSPVSILLSSPGQLLESQRYVGLCMVSTKRIRVLVLTYLQPRKRLV